MTDSDLTRALKARLLEMPGVVTRRMFGTEAYFVGQAMFAFFSPVALIARVPPGVLGEAVAQGLARPFLSFGAAQLNGWAEVPLAGQTAESLERILRAAHTSGTHAARSAARRRKPSRARRVKAGR